MTITDERFAITEPGVYTMDDTTYHADPVPAGSLSSSGAKKLLPPSCPAIFDWERKNPPAPKATFDFGHAAHQLVLGAGPQIVEVEADDWRTKAAKEAAEEARAAGGVPLLTKDVAVVNAMATELRRHPVAAALFSQGVPESSLFWQDARFDVWRRARFDWLPDAGNGRLIIPDYKTSTSASPQKFPKVAFDFGYYMQAAWYIDTALALGLAEDVAFVFVVQDKNAPYLVSVNELDALAIRIGRDRNDRALEIFHDCMQSDTWPGFGDDVNLVALPGWVEHAYQGDTL